MSINLTPPYENPIEQAMAELASTVHILNPEAYDEEADGLFAALVRGLYIYVEAWAKSGDDNSLAALMVDADDLNDPSRADDPHATFISLLDLALEAIHDNIRCELDPKYGQWVPDGES